MNQNTQIKSWIKLSEQTLHDYKFCQIYKCKFQHPINDKAGEFIVSNYSDSIQIIAETIDHKFIFVKQFRFGSEQMSLEFPAGRLEKDESPIEGAIRELREETGYIGQNATLMASLYPNPAIIRNKIYVIKIEKCEKICDTNFDPFEDIQTILIFKNEILNFVKNGEMNNCITLAAFYYLFF